MGMISESDAIEAMVLRLLDSFPLPAPTHGTVDSYIDALEGLDPQAVAKAVREFCSGRLDRNHAFRPNAAEVAARARQWHEAMHPRYRPLALPPSEISEEERARVRERFAELNAQHQGREAERVLAVAEAARKRLDKTNAAALARDPRSLEERLSAGRIKLEASAVEVSAELG